MKGFIELTRTNQHKVLVQIDDILSAQEPIEKDLNYNSYVLYINGYEEGYMETYDEVKALIAETRGEDIEPKRMSKEEGMQATFKVLRDIKENCAERWGCNGCEFRTGTFCALQKNPACWTV